MSALRSGWFIDDIELPIAPNSDQRNISRTFQSETLFNFFPNLTKSTARAFDYTIKGIIYPEDRAFALDQIAKSADTNVVIVIIPLDQQIFTALTKYAVKSLIFDRKGPLFVKVEGVVLKALTFTLTLTELPDEGEFQEGIDGFTDADEDALGMQQLNELAEEHNLGGAIDLQSFGPLSGWGILTGEVPAF